MISVIIPAYNCEKYVEQAMESVMRQTIQEDIELLVIDDASQDATENVIECYRKQHGNAQLSGKIRSIQYIRNEKNLGVAETRNRGIQAAGGEYVAFLDADDWWTEDKLEKQMRLLKEKKSVLVFAGRELMREDGNSTGKIIGVPEEASYASLLRTNYIPCSSVILKTEVAKEFYMCHDELHEDYILWLKVLQKYKKAYGINEPLLKSRLSAGGKSRNKFKSAKMHFGVYRYMGIPGWKAIWLFLCYTVNGVRKYR